MIFCNFFNQQSKSVKALQIYQDTYTVNLVRAERRTQNRQERRGAGRRTLLILLVDARMSSN